VNNDLPYGFALHFCILISDEVLSNRRCLDLAEGFVGYLSKAR